jgi:hypothetical protein
MRSSIPQHHELHLRLNISALLTLVQVHRVHTEEEAALLILVTAE